MKQILALLIFLMGIFVACYTGGWLLFIKPIIECCKAFDAGTLTGVMVSITVMKCIFAGTVAGIIVWISSIIAAIFGR